MLLFYGLSVFLLLGALVPNKKQGFYLLISFFILFVLSAYRDVNVGTDTKNYEFLFGQFGYGDEWIGYAIEPGWVFLNEFVISYGGQYRDLIIISSLLTLIPIFFVAKKYSHNPMLTISIFYLLYFYFLSWNVTRQSIALSLFLIGLILLLKNRRLWFVSVVVFAALFHESILVTLPLIFINKVPTNKAKLLTYIFIAMVLGIYGIGYISSIAKLIGYGIYIQEFASGNILGNLIFLLIFNSFFAFILFTSAKVTIEVKLFFVFIFVLNLTTRLPFGDRIVLYFSIYQILFYPYYLSTLKNHTTGSIFISYILIILFIYVMFIQNIGSGSGEIIPYANILF